MQITQKLIPVPSARRSGEKILDIKYIVCHDTGNDGSTALSNVDYYIQSAQLEQASAHIFIDDKGAVQCIPLTEKAWHVRYNAGISPNIEGSFSNDHAIGVELCFSSKGLFDSKKSYDNYCSYIASLLIIYKLDMTKLVQHAKLDPTRRTDPINAFSKIGKTWEMFLSDVGALINVPIINNSSNTNNMETVKFVKFFNSVTHEVVTVFADQGYKVQNDGETFEFATATEAQAKDTNEVFLFWDNAPVGVGTATA